MTVPIGSRNYTVATGTSGGDSTVFSVSQIPNSSNINYPEGQRWIVTSTNAEYVLTSFSVSNGNMTANWTLLGSAAGGLNTLTGDTGSASPSAANISILGTANQVTTTGSGSQIQLSTPATFIAPGSIASTTTITSGTGLTVTTGGLIVSAGPTTLAALTAVGTASINASGAAATTIGTGGTGAVSIGNATGGTAITGAATFSTTLGVTGLSTLAALTAVGTASINASGAAATTIGTGGTGTVSIGNATGNTAVTGSLTASTTLTATSGAITATSGDFIATNGNLQLQTVGNKILIKAGTTGFAGTGTLASGTVTIANTNIAAGDIIILTRNGANASTTFGILSYTISAATSFTVTSLILGTPGSTQTGDTSTFSYLIIRPL